MAYRSTTKVDFDWQSIMNWWAWDQASSPSTPTPSSTTETQIFRMDHRANSRWDFESDYCGRIRWDNRSGFVPWFRKRIWAIQDSEIDNQCDLSSIPRKNTGMIQVIVKIRSYEKDNNPDVEYSVRSEISEGYSCKDWKCWTHYPQFSETRYSSHSFSESSSSVTHDRMGSFFTTNVRLNSDEFSCIFPMKLPLVLNHYPLSLMNEINTMEIHSLFMKTSLP
jgi:hypothetical protein